MCIGIESRGYDYRVGHCPIDVHTSQPPRGPIYFGLSDFDADADTDAFSGI